MSSIIDIIGLKVVAIKGCKNDYRTNKKAEIIEPEYIFFDDGETYITLSEQDYHCYHDCSYSARHIYVHKNRNEYDALFNLHSLSPTNSDI